MTYLQISSTSLFAARRPKRLLPYHLLVVFTHCLSSQVRYNAPFTPDINCHCLAYALRGFFRRIPTYFASFPGYPRPLNNPKQYVLPFPYTYTHHCQALGYLHVVYSLSNLQKPLYRPFSSCLICNCTLYVTNTRRTLPRNSVGSPSPRLPLLSICLSGFYHYGSLGLRS